MALDSRFDRFCYFWSDYTSLVDRVLFVVQNIQNSTCLQVLVETELEFFKSEFDFFFFAKGL